MHLVLRATALLISLMVVLAGAQAADAAAALARAERQLVAKPGDVSARFERGVALTELNRTDEAIAAFRSLTEDHPELAEPYNNLAALYAAQGRIEQARAALEQALRSRPDYAVAHENLGDIYAMLAARSWERATQADPSLRGAAAKLALARDLLRIKNPKE